MTGTRAQITWKVAGATTVGAITWVTRLAGLMTLGSILIPAGRRSLRGHLAEWLELPQEATVAAATVASCGSSSHSDRRPRKLRRPAGTRTDTSVISPANRVTQVITPTDVAPATRQVVCALVPVTTCATRCE